MDPDLAHYSALQLRLSRSSKLNLTFYTTPSPSLHTHFSTTQIAETVSRSHTRRATATMGRAEAGSTKWVANKMKSVGLQRLRWWCEPCQKQCRDANGFKCHVQSEAHVRQMSVVGQDPRKAISGFSNDFQQQFVTLLRTAHGEKWINVVSPSFKHTVRPRNLY
jgi:hypothetical protein